MDWNKEYHPERRVSWEDVAETIRETVTMDDVLSVYAPSTPRKGRRCPCPIHNGKDYNFSYTDKGYKCFVCNSSGDVITFIKEVCELATRVDAMREIIRDFRLNLNIGEVITHEQDNTLRMMRAAAEKKKREHDEWYAKYHSLLDEWCALDRELSRSDAPSPAEVARTRQRMAEVEYALDSLPPEPR